MQGLGCACGCLGYFAISKLGGSPQLWLGLWWTWIGGQSALVMNLDAVHALLQPPEQAQKWPTRRQMRRKQHWDAGSPDEAPIALMCLRHEHVL